MPQGAGLSFILGRDSGYAVDRERRAARDAGIGQFAYCTAHDIGNLLAAITLSLARLRGRQATGEMEEAVEQALQAAEQGIAATRTLLRTVSGRSGSTEIFDPNDCIRSARSLLQVAGGLRVRLALALAPEAWKVAADPHAAVLALLNLTTNARDAMPSGGDLRLTTANVSLRGQVEGLTGDFVAISVTDTGKGMSAAVISRACRPFYTTKPEGQGTGLGLTQVGDFAHSSRGAISIESKLGRGSTVTLYLPRAMAH
jgi:two-component system, NtrC family, sensor kinase